MAAPSHMRKHGRGQGEAPMPLSSMMDMMTIILLFLLKSYSATGALMTPVDEMDLPASDIDSNPRKALSIVVDSGRKSGITGVFVEQDGERKQLLDEANSLVGVATGAAANDPRSMILPGLEGWLMEQAAKARDREEQFGIPFEGYITIQADREVNYNSILKVLATCGSAGYNMTEFVVLESQ